MPQESAINQDSQFNPNCDINLDMTDLGLQRPEVESELLLKGSFAPSPDKLDQEENHQAALRREEAAQKSSAGKNQDISDLYAPSPYQHSQDDNLETFPLPTTTSGIMNNLGNLQSTLSDKMSQEEDSPDFTHRKIDPTRQNFAASPNSIQNAQTLSHEEEQKRPLEDGARVRLNYADSRTTEKKIENEVEVQDEYEEAFDHPVKQEKQLLVIGFDDKPLGKNPLQHRRSPRPAWQKPKLQVSERSGGSPAGLIRPRPVRLDQGNDKQNDQKQQRKR